MTNATYIDPELAPILTMFPSLRLDAATLDQTRAQMATMFAGAPVSPEPPTSVSEHRVPGSAGAPPVRVLMYKPQGVEHGLPAILHIHGGGYVMGAPEGSDQANRVLASELQCVIVSVDYRLAPETSHPGPVEDCYAALCWLSANADELGVDTARIGVKGESAGGGLAAALTLLSRDRGGPTLAFQHLIYPMLDDRSCTASEQNPFVGQFIWTPENNAFGWSALLGAAPGTPDISPYAAPARATDLANLPPAFISIGDLDLFLEEDLDYARRLRRAGVSTELHVYPGAFHGFELVANARVSQEAMRNSTEALRRALR